MTVEEDLVVVIYTYPCCKLTGGIFLLIEIRSPLDKERLEILLSIGGSDTMLHVGGGECGDAVAQSDTDGEDNPHERPEFRFVNELVASELEYYDELWRY